MRELSPSLPESKTQARAERRRATGQSAPPNEDQFLAIVPKNAVEEVRIALSRFKGTDLVDIRVFAAFSRTPDNERRPTKKGVSLKLQYLQARRDLAEADLMPRVSRSCRCRSRPRLSIILPPSALAYFDAFPRRANDAPTGGNQASANFSRSVHEPTARSKRLLSSRADHRERFASGASCTTSAERLVVAGWCRRSRWLCGSTEIEPPWHGILLATAAPRLSPRTSSVAVWL
jgi:hypothetical protein